MNAALGPGREFDIIRSLLDRWGPHVRDIGDDAAVLPIPRGDALVASIDATVENRHFRREWLSPREIGYRAVAAALSDLAAMASHPAGVLLGLAVPESWEEDLLELADGIGEAVELVRAPILGGNMTAAGELSITTTVLGSAHGVLRRDALWAEDHLYVTGTLGGPGAAVRAWLAGKQPAAEHRERFVHPVPRIREALWLADRGATAAIDVSDGLSADAAHLAAASQVRIVLDLDAVPRVHGVTAVEMAASGEEYELLVAAPHELDADAFRAAFGLPLTHVGRVVDGTGVELESGGERVANVGGHDHFSR